MRKRANGQGWERQLADGVRLCERLGGGGGTEPTYQPVNTPHNKATIAYSPLAAKLDYKIVSSE
jgi:hypothetical protein